MSIKTILLAFTAMAIYACAPGNDFPEVGISAGLVDALIEAGKIDVSGIVMQEICIY